MSERPGFPIAQKAELQRSELEFFSFEDRSLDLRGRVPEWFASWRDPDTRRQREDELARLFGCPVIEEFTQRLFHGRRVVGVLHSARRTMGEENTDWLVLRRQDAAEESITLETLLSARLGEFLFLIAPLEMSREEVGEDLVDRFFATFSSLRDSPPFFGGDELTTYPNEMSADMFESRAHYQPEWLGSSRLATRGNCDYLILSSQGRVGYMPIEGERWIEVYAETFEGAIMKWIDEPREDRPAVTNRD